MNKSIDVFLSHHTDSTKNLVIETAEMIEKLGWTCWYAERDISPLQNYAEKIPDILEKTKLFVLFLNEHSNQSDEVLREIIAVAKNAPILVYNLDNCRPRKSLQYLCSVSQMKPLSDIHTSMLSQHISEEVCALLGDEKAIKALSKAEMLFRPVRSKNDLMFFGEAFERERLSHQHKFILKFAKESYESILKDFENASFLDVGCNTGTQAKLLLEGCNGITKYIGIDREEEALSEGRALYPDSHFFVADCEADDFSNRLKEIKKELGIEAFDVINISMVLLHIQSPEVLLDVLEDHLSDDGIIIALDIDDGFTVAYPDTDGFYRRAIDICHETLYSGFRHSGRQVYSYMYNSGLSNVTLHKIGLSTAGLSRSERGELFDVYFSFILDDLQKMHEIDPENRVIKAELDWFNDCYKLKRVEFKNKDNFFNLGFMLMSARRGD